MKAKADLSALRYFVAVAEHGGYSRAAAALHLTQPAVSRQIQQLERTYKARLFRREGRLMSLTEAGQELLAEARTILSRFDSLDRVVGAASKEPTGLLSIGITWATWESLLPQVLARFRAKYPKVFLRVIQDVTDRLANALVAHELDIAVLYHRPRETDLDFVPLMETEMGLVVSNAAAASQFKALLRLKTISLSRALQQPLVLPPHGHALRDLLESHGVRQRVALKVPIESDSLPLSKSLVLAGHGCTVDTLGSVHEEVSRGEFRFIPIRSPSILWRMYAATAKQHPQTQAHKAMLQELGDYIRTSTASERWSGQVLKA